VASPASGLAEVWQGVVQWFCNNERRAVMALIMYVCGVISLVLAPFTGITVVTAAAFFVIGYLIDIA
jgi:hypothetical protein